MPKLHEMLKPDQAQYFGKQVRDWKFFNIYIDINLSRVQTIAINRGRRPWYLLQKMEESLQKWYSWRI